MNIYEGLERRYPERQNQLGQNPPPPVPLTACPRCGSQPRPAKMCRNCTPDVQKLHTRSLYAIYGCPRCKVRCAYGQQTAPEPWAVGLIFCDDPHTVTEPETLRNACDRWNAEQLRTIRAAAVPAAVTAGRCEP